MTKTAVSAVLAAATALVLAAAPATAGWEGTRWGMTPEELAQAVPGTRPPVERDGRTRISARHRFGALETTALFGFEAGALVSVSLLVAGRDRCAAAEARVIGMQGEPMVVETGADGFVSWGWRDPAADNSVVFQKRPEHDGQVKFCLIGYAPADATGHSPGF